MEHRSHNSSFSAVENSISDRRSLQECIRTADDAQASDNQNFAIAMIELVFAFFDKSETVSD